MSLELASSPPPPIILLFLHLTYLSVPLTLFWSSRARIKHPLDRIPDPARVAHLHLVQPPASLFQLIAT
jgi:hypothetical protein